MKVQVSKYWQLDLHVIRILITPVFLLLCLNSLSQDNIINGNEYYQFIEEIAFEAKIIDCDEFKKLHNWVKIGKFTQQDSIRYVERKKNHTPVIFSTTDNSALKKVLEESLLSSFRSLDKYFTDNQIRSIIDNIPEEKTLQNNFSDKVSLLERDSNRKYGHFFSSPVLIEDNRYILYHYHYDNNIYGTVELIVVTKLDMGYKIKYRVHFDKWNF